MKISFSLFTALFFFSLLNPAYAYKRTDGKEGSEWGDFSLWGGEFQVGAQFGAIVFNNDTDSNISLGVDFDYRPAELFGIRLTYLQGLQSPRISDFSITPLVHTRYSNLRPYAFFGPGIAIVNFNNDTTAKFMFDFGAGADIEIVDQFSIGMLYTYHLVFDVSDHHSITARVAYVF